jgi:spore germination protein YaaH
MMKHRLMFLALIVMLLLAFLPAVAWAAPNQSPRSSPCGCGYYYRIRWGDTLARIATRHGVSMWAIARANGITNINYIVTGRLLWIPCGWHPRQCVHYVRWGDTLGDLAWRYGVSVWAIARANGITNVDVIWPGQRLVIPGCWH